MSSTEQLAGRLAEAQPLGERLRRAFFRSFFSLLLVFLGFAEWACIAWVLGLAGVEVPLPVYLAAPFAVLAFNRWILVVRGSRRGRPRPVVARLIRGYAAVAFTCIFCGLFLGAAALLHAVVVFAAAPATALLAGVMPGARSLGQAYPWAVNGGAATVAGLMLYGFTLGQRQLVVSRLQVPIRGLPPALDGFRIVHLSDLHVGQYLDLEELAAHVRRVNALEPDLICLTGDLVDRAETCALAFPTLAGLRARHGVLATLGNHDFYAGAERVTASLRRLTPFTVLRNARTEVTVGAASLPILGVDDLGRDWARGVLEHPALAGLVAALPAGAPVLLLSHRPDCFAQAARLGVSLMLSGHTHGGQLALPAWLGGRRRNLAEFITDYDRGEFRRGDSTLYVNRGLGFTGQKIRLFTPREIACLELRAC